MFERYTEKARRVIFFARYEASQFGSPYIETEHLLLGLLREDKALTNRLLGSHASVESIRKQIEAHTTTVREKVSTSVDLPLSNECKRVLAYAAEEAEGLSHRHIGTEHLLLGLLREEKCFAAEILHERGLQLDAIREELKREPAKPAPSSQSVEAPILRAIQSDLTQLASDAKLPAFVGREKEMEALISLLTRSSKNNVVLVGEPGVGRRAMVEGLAQRIVEGNVPPALAEMSVVDLNISRIAGQSSEKLVCWIEGAFTLLSATSVVSPGDRLFLFTDGITEAEQANGQEFGVEGITAFAKANSAGSASGLTNLLLAQIREFCRGRFQDDATLVVIAAE